VQGSQNIRYLDQGELEAVLRAIAAEDDYGACITRSSWPPR
jgi:hypothetical protein